MNNTITITITKSSVLIIFFNAVFFSAFLFLYLELQNMSLQLKIIEASNNLLISQNLELKNVILAIQERSMEVANTSMLIKEKTEVGVMSDKFKIYLINTSLIILGTATCAFSVWYIGSSISLNIGLILSGLPVYLKSFFFEQVKKSAVQKDGLGNYLYTETKLSDGSMEYFIKPINTDVFVPHTIWAKEHPSFKLNSLENLDLILDSIPISSEGVNAALSALY